MEKNWIETVKEFIHRAMNKGLLINGYDSCPFIDDKNYSYNFNIEGITFSFLGFDESFVINTKHGFFKINYKLSDRDKLELSSLMLSIKEYREDMALSEFNSFFNEMDKPTDINDLDNDDE